MSKIVYDETLQKILEYHEKWLCGEYGADVFITDKELAREFPYDIECKNTEQAPIYKFIEQAKANTKEGSQWLIVHKKNYNKPIVIMDAEHFFELYKSILK